MRLANKLLESVEQNIQAKEAEDNKNVETIVYHANLSKKY